MNAGDYLWQIDVSYPSGRIRKTKSKDGPGRIKLYIAMPGRGNLDRSAAEDKAHGFCKSRAYPDYRIDRAKCLGTIDA